MPYQLQPITNKIFGELNQTFENNQRDLFTIKRLKHEAEKLFHVDATSAYMALGAIAALEGNIEALHENYKKAINLCPIEVAHFREVIILNQYVMIFVKFYNLF